MKTDNLPSVGETRACLEATIEFMKWMRDKFPGEFPGGMFINYNDVFSLAKEKLKGDNKR